MTALGPENAKGVPEKLPEVTDDDLQRIPEEYRFVLAQWLRQRCVSGEKLAAGAILLGEKYTSGHNGALSGAAADLVEPSAPTSDWVTSGRRLNYLDAWWRDHAKRYQRATRVDAALRRRDLNDQEAAIAAAVESVDVDAQLAAITDPGDKHRCVRCNARTSDVGATARLCNDCAEDHGV